MGQTAAEVRDDIERTRQEMSGTIDAITDRTSPSRVMARQRRRVADRARSVVDRVMGTAEDAGRATQQNAGQAVDAVREAPARAGEAVRAQTTGNPLAAGLVAFGMGALAATLIPTSPGERRVARELRREAEPALDAVRETGREVVDDLKGTAREAADEVAATASEAARGVADEARAAGDEVRRQAETAAHEVRDEARPG